jgi:hypothetical protein
MSNESAGTVVNVATVEELYGAVNDPTNAGAVIVLAPGIYSLSANGPDGSPRPNGGRIELREDMSLFGLAGDRSAVVIDTSALPAASLNVSFGRTGSIRIGLGSNAIEWLTVLGNPIAASGIEADLPGTSDTNIRIAHVASGGSTRGVDVRNVGAVNAGRRIDAEIVDSDFSSAPTAIGQKEAMRIANFLGAVGGQIYASMRGNRFHDTDLGCIIANNRSSSAVVEVRSHGDTFENNGVGCVIAGAINTLGTGVTNWSSTTFAAHGTKFVNNTGREAFGGSGITAFGADVRGTNLASNNTVQILLRGCTFSGNQSPEFRAFGARNILAQSPNDIPGTNNKVTIELYGDSKQVEVVATDSIPFEPEGTNTVTVIR